MVGTAAVAMRSDGERALRRASEAWTAQHYALLSAIALLQIWVRVEVPTDTSMLWAARSGSDVLNTGRLPHTDSYSWTAHGRQWIPNSWAWNVVLGAGYKAMGIIGFWIVGAALAVLMGFTVAWVAQRIGAPPLPTIAMYAPIGVVGLVVVPRAQTISTIVPLLIPMLTAAAVWSDRRGSGRAIALLVVLQIAWMNIHSAALIGPALVFVCGSAALFAGRRDRSFAQGMRRLVAVSALCAAACVATPYGSAPLRHALDVRNASVGLISEWKPVGFGSFMQLVALVCVVAAPLLVWRVWRAGRPEVAAGILVIAVSTASAIRFLPMLCVFAAPELALFVSGAKVRRGLFKIAVAMMTVLLVGVGIRNMRDLSTLDASTSYKLVAALPSGCRLLNDDSVGDVVVLRRPDVPVALDTRNDMYGRKTLLETLRLFEDKPGTNASLARDGVTCVLGPSWTPLVKRLSADGDWTVLGRDSVRTLIARSPRAGA